MRHATAAHFAPGGGDRDRPLTTDGQAQVRRVGALLADEGIERVLCSPATRTRQTADGLGLKAAVTVLDPLYNCPPERILTALARLPEYVRGVLVVGHFPGIPGLVQQLADRSADLAEVSRLARHFPPATVVELEFADPWPDLHAARLVRVRRP
ncbi:MAG: histidine phosphatase family protein [Propionicimonas sp.]|nr:histidine phosphatase family protein [Propionicimonas sp.]